MKGFRLVAVVLCLVGWLMTSRSLQAADAVAAADDDAVILPYMSDATFLVARLDVDRVDAKAIDDYMQKASQMMFAGTQVPKEQRARMDAEVKQSAEKTKKWLAGMSDAGGKRVYAVVDWAGDVRRGGPVLVVPVPKGGDPDKIAAAFNLNDQAFSGASTRQIGDAVVLGDTAQLERVEQTVQAGGIKATDRPELAEAFKAAGDAPLRLALVPGEPTRSWLEGNLPSIPQPFGGGETQILSRGVKYASVAITQKPKTLASLAVHCEDAEKAKALLDVMNKGTEYARQSLAKAPEKVRATWAGQLENIKPKLDGDTIKMSIDPIMLMGKAGLVRAEREVDVQTPAPAQKKSKTPATTGEGGL
jgi:hypothetical protein